MLDVDLATLIIAFIVLLFSLTVHETAHAWTADRLGDPTARMLGRISLNPLVHADPIGTFVFPLVAMFTGAPLIGWAKPVPVNVGRLRHSRRSYVLVAAAGPISNVLLAAIAALGLRMILVQPITAGTMNVSAPVALLLSRMIQLNVLLAVFNMLPIPPLDGGNVVGGLLPARLERGFNVIRPYGIIVLYVLMFAGTLFTLIAPPSRFLMDWLLP